MANKPNRRWKRPMFTNTAMSVRSTHNYAGRGEQGIVLRHEQFLRDMNSASITVGNAGWDLDANGNVVRFPVAIFADPLDTNATGLMPGNGPIYDMTKVMTDYISRRGMLMAIVADAHVNDQHVDAEAMTQHIITVDYYNQFTLEEKERADRYFFGKMEIPALAEREDHIRQARNPASTPKQRLNGERWLRYQQENRTLPDNGQDAQYLKVQEVAVLFGPSPDGEFRPFLFGFEHCIEPLETGGKGTYRWVPFVADLFKQIQSANRTARENGEAAPDNRIVSFHKVDLRPNVSNGQRGTDGNLLEEFLLASQYGMPQGPNHDSQRRMVVFGMGTPYTVLYAVLNGLALGFRVTLQMSATFNFDPSGVSMFELVRVLRHMFPYAFEARMYWDEQLMCGPQPTLRDGRTFNQAADEVKDLLIQHWQATGGAQLNMSFYAFGDVNDLQQVVNDLNV